MDNLYDVLGVTQDATEAELKRAFRALSKKYHPDVNPGDRKAEEKFREVSEAYSLLQDSHKRAEYDKKLDKEKNGGAHRNTVKQDPMFRGMQGVDLGNIGKQFENFFGFQPKQAGKGREEVHKKGTTKANPIDMTEMFEKYMGIHR